MSIIPLYASAITDAVTTGDLGEMKKLRTLTEEHIREHGDIPALLQHLKVEIAKAEARKP